MPLLQRCSTLFFKICLKICLVVIVIEVPQTAYSNTTHPLVSVVKITSQIHVTGNLKACTD